MTRKETIRLLAYLGIKAFPVHAAHLGDWCVWSEYSRAIGNRLTNNERHFGKRDLYVSFKDKKRIEAECQKIKEAKKAKEAKEKSSRAMHRYRLGVHLSIDIIDFT